MALQEAFNRAQEDRVERNLNKALVEIDRMVAEFSRGLGRKIDKFLHLIASGESKYVTEKLLKHSIEIDKRLELTPELLLTKTEKMQNMPAMVKLLRACSAPEQDACVTLQVLWWWSNVLGFKQGISATLTIDPTKRFEESALIIGHSKTPKHIPLSPLTPTAKTTSFLRKLPVIGRCL